MSNRSAAPFPPSGTRFLPAEPLGPIELRQRERATPAKSQPGREEVPVDELVFCHLQTLGEIAGISHLREELQLPESVLADPGFHAREKKEISTDSSGHLSCAEGLSELFASSR